MNFIKKMFLVLALLSRQNSYSDFDSLLSKSCFVGSLLCIAQSVNNFHVYSNLKQQNKTHIQETNGIKFRAEDALDKQLKETEFKAAVDRSFAEQVEGYLRSRQAILERNNTSIQSFMDKEKNQTIRDAIIARNNCMLYALIGGSLFFTGYKLSH